MIAAALLGGCGTTQLDPNSLTRARFTLEADGASGYAASIVLPVSQVRIPVENDAILSEFDYQSIQLAELELGKCLRFSLKPAAARELYRITVGNQGKRLVLLVNGKPLGVRRIDGPIADGVIMVFAELPDKELEALAGELGKTNFEIQKSLNR